VTDELFTDDQQAERAKQWLRENGIYIAAGVLFGLGGLFGWQGWKDYQLEQAGEASVVWEKLRNAAAGERFNEVNEMVALLESDYSATPYLDQARLTMARLYMDRNDVDGALQQLRTLQQQGRDPMLQQIAVLREAQILISEQQYSTALELLASEPSRGMAGLHYELRGDALFAQGEFSAARDAYQAALNNDAGGAIDRNFVQMKLDDVAVSLSSVNESASSGELPSLEPLPDAAADSVE
jgi:predicted negative regulator of RcsB-dependent stress response